MLYFNRNIPDEAHQKIGEYADAGIAAFAATPSGGWVAVARDGRYFARGIPDECFQKLGEFIGQGDKVRVIAFPPAGGNSWVIVTDRNYFARNIPDECFKELQAFVQNGWWPTCIAFPPSGGNSWVILAGGAIYARNIPGEPYQQLCNAMQTTRPARHVSFTPSGGGCSVSAEDYYWARNVPQECFSKIADFEAQGVMVDRVVFFPNGGWSVQANDARPARAADPLWEFALRVQQSGGAWQDIWSRMAAHHVPGVSVAVIQNNRVAWAGCWGLAEAGTDRWVGPDTVFQAASISKMVSAAGYLRLVQDNLIQMDDAVRNHLGTWTLGRRSCTQAGWLDGVTLRRLLLHRAGIVGRGTTDPRNACSNFQADSGGGFGGYPRTAGVGLPTLREVLDGASTRSGVSVNSPKSELTHQPDTTTSYSGMGYVVMMQLLETLRGTAFASWMQTQVLDATGMAHSTFAIDPPASWPEPAAGHDASGAVIAGKRNRYPESPAAGLYTTPHDLAAYLIMLNRGGQTDSGRVLAQTRAEDITQRSLGSWPSGAAGTAGYGYGHNGANVGFRCDARAFPNRSAGYVIMTNGDAGDALYPELETALTRIYGWWKADSSTLAGRACPVVNPGG
jgi:CubicO group peptidase (beta-lactamase class C family)